MKFQLSNLKQNVAIISNDKFKLKPVKFFTKERNQHRFENKVICGIILNCTSPTTATKATSVYNANKKTRTSYQPPKSYHRWFLCADAMKPPHTFVIVTHTHQQTCQLLRHVHDSSFVGMPFYLVEPNLSTSRVGEYLHVLEHKGETLYPLRANARILKQPAPVDLPSGSDQTFYFVLEGEKIRLTRMKFSTMTCTGYQCDRHWGKDGCVCAYGSMGNSLVYEFDFEIPVDHKQFNSDSHIASLSSFTTMSVFFHNLVEYTHATTPSKEEKFLFRRRSQIRRLIDYINADCGWKITGWCKRGLLSVDGETEKVENTKVNLRLTSVYPQDDKIFHDPIFQAIRIKEDFDLFDHQLPNLFEYTTTSDSSSSSSDSDSDDTSVKYNFNSNSSGDEHDDRKRDVKLDGDNYVDADDVTDGNSSGLDLLSKCSAELAEEDDEETEDEEDAGDGTDDESNVSGGTHSSAALAEEVDETEDEE